ncbi:flagellar hook protein FlgE [Kineococcus radiotolerans]|uniref:Flagellar hook protein FlgE n=1 Tax=Kineococcus radiotolerans TaxID=131568 RepID=A0A7W4TIR7_KINRA|nr:flagellar hook protein FlgE [Kineococcus radiotolerans]MBB2899645.1 flagellar hook protein FlgE [Kineococcus radiotolerans]
MLRSMFSGVSGLRSHQTMMDVVGNNIANVNTAGYKSSGVVFADTMSQLTKAAGAPTTANGGTNPSQVGLGVRVQAITQNMTQGSAQATGKSTDLMLQGDGMFAVQSGDGVFYTRNGSFTLDANGSIVTNDGAYVMGWKPDATGKVNTNSQIDKLVIPSDTVMPAQITKTGTITGNLDNTLNAGALRSVPTSFKAYDDQGNLTTVYLRFDNQQDPAVTGGTVAKSNTWNVSWSTDPTFPTGKTLVAGSINFAGVSGGADGSKAVFTPAAASATAGPITVDGKPVALDFAGLTGFVGTTGSSSVQGKSDGSPIGTLVSYSFGTDGVITGSYSNGYKQTLGQVAVASFNNSAGLRKEGNSLYSVSTNSGAPVYGIAGENGRGGLLAGSLEMSNVDLSAEFTNLILAQRGFQANSKVITSSDELLQDLVNLKR